MLFISSLVLSLATLAFAAPQPAGMSTKREMASQADITEWLQLHNQTRFQSQVLPLQWNNTLAQYAEDWACKCDLKPSGGPYGENSVGGHTPIDIYGEFQVWNSESSALLFSTRSEVPEADECLSEVQREGP
jgi:pathogenesis-related protein 1